ncbi:zinc-binding dehydrogenase [Staphylococcus shinii]|uniref:zinc-binding dehydrogenase n=2 Tax=Staphylococcus shinii TaxID=2912228 RepID=UPI003F55B563
MKFNSIGMFAVQWAKIFGIPKVISVGIDDEKLEITKQIGVDFTINPLNKEALQLISEHINSINVDLVIEVAGSPAISSTEANIQIVM